MRTQRTKIACESRFTLTQRQGVAKPAGRDRRYLSALASVPGIFSGPLPRDEPSARAAVRAILAWHFE
jgi:hypothetical protein